MPPGGDWFLVGHDDCGRLDVRANIKTVDDALIYVQYFGTAWHRASWRSWNAANLRMVTIRSTSSQTRGSRRAINGMPGSNTLQSRNHSGII